MSRTDSHAQRRADEQRVAGGLDAGRLDGYQLIALMRVLRDRLGACARRRSVAPLMDFVYANLASGARILADVPIACGRGCSHCCNLWVDATAPEVFHAIGSLGMDAGRSAIGQVDRALTLTQDQSFEARGTMVTPCPMLVDTWCSVYDARPINCRTAVSSDAELCRRSYLDMSGEDVPMPLVWVALRQGYAVALEGAMLNAGLAPRAREWNQSLRIALTETDAEARWLGGEDVFAGAPAASGPGFMDQPGWHAMYLQAFGE